jgi:hypothetical protein
VNKFHLGPKGRAAIAVTFAASMIAGFGSAYATAQAAVPMTAQITNTATGEAGYYANDNGSTRFRDVGATTVVANTMKQLNGTPTTPGGVGVELCDDNTNAAAQLGLEWNGNAFTLQYNDGFLTDPLVGTIQDPCAQDGLLAGGAGHTYPHPIVPIVGDVLKFEIFYQPSGHHHYLQFKVTDETQNRTEVQEVQIPAQNFYEAGIGVLTDAANLTGGAVNLLNSFTNTTFNYYSSTKAWGSIYVPAHWDLEEAHFVNASSQVTLSPNNSLNGPVTGFSLYEGSTSS